MNIMHTISSHKGGVGKTIKALSLAYHYMQSKKNCVILVDANPMNSNIADDLFYYFHQEKLAPCNLVDNALRKTYTVSRGSTNTFSVIDATEGNIRDVISSIEDQAPPKDDTNYIYIVDTNAHIKNLMGLEPPVNPDNWRQYFWFIWGWSIPRLHHHPNEIFRTVSYLENWYPVRQVIHSFNMYDFFDVGFSLTRKSSVTMKPLQKIVKIIDKRINLAKSHPDRMQLTYAPSKVMKEWINEARKKLLEFKIPQDLPIDKLPALWAETIMLQFEKYPDTIPYNVLLIPTFYEELVMAMDRLIMGEHSSWKEIHHTLKPMMSFIHRWVCNMEQFCS
jgi:hypothetical protein